MGSKYSFGRVSTKSVIVLCPHAGTLCNGEKSFDAHFTFMLVCTSEPNGEKKFYAYLASYGHKVFKKVRFQLCSTLLWLGQPTSHMCV